MSARRVPFTRGSASVDYAAASDEALLMPYYGRLSGHIFLISVIDGARRDYNGFEIDRPLRAFHLYLPRDDAHSPICPRHFAIFAIEHLMLLLP